MNTPHVPKPMRWEPIFKDDNEFFNFLVFGDKNHPEGLPTTRGRMFTGKPIETVSKVETVELEREWAKTNE